MNTAVVVHYDAARKFGFMKPGVNSETSIYFRLGYQQAFVFNGDDKPERLNVPPEALITPSVGDIVYLETEKSPVAGLRAKWWGYKNEYDEAQQACESRLTYRLRHRDGRIPKSRLQANSEPCTYRTLLESRNVSDFRKELRYHAIHNREWSAIYFEFWNNDIQQWELCGDPTHGDLYPARAVPA